MDNDKIDPVILLTADEQIRLNCLGLAVQTSVGPMGMASEQAILAKAEMFTNYVKGVE